MDISTVYRRMLKRAGEPGAYRRALGMWKQGELQASNADIAKEYLKNNWLGGAIGGAASLPISYLVYRALNKKKKDRSWLKALAYLGTGATIGATAGLGASGYMRAGDLWSKYDEAAKLIKDKQIPNYSVDNSWRNRFALAALPDAELARARESIGKGLEWLKSK